MTRALILVFGIEKEGFTKCLRRKVREREMRMELKRGNTLLCFYCLRIAQKIQEPAPIYLSAKSEEKKT